MKRNHWILAGAIVAGLAFCTLAAIFLVGHSNPAIKDDPMLFTTEGHPGGISEGGSSIRVAFEWSRNTLLIPTSDPEVVAMLEAARNAGENVSFRLRMAGAHFDADSGLPVFWVQTLAYRDKTFGPYPVKVPWSWRVLVDEQASLLKGIGYHYAYDYNGALAEFDKGLRNGMLKPVQRGLAMALRAEAYENKAYAEPATVGKDYLLVRASEDYDAAARLRPEDFSLRTSRAGVLVRLGAYDDALALLEEALKKSPEAHFHAGIMAADVMRLLGRNAEALRVLDEVGERDGDKLGMMYFYHRGWTLLLLERNPEAAEAFSEGLKSQRGWPWVYLGRGCARHRTSDDESALADLRTALQIVDKGADRDGEESTALRAELRNNIGALERQAKPRDLSVCQHFESNFDRPLRERSNLLDSTQPAS